LQINFDIDKLFNVAINAKLMTGKIMFGGRTQTNWDPSIKNS